MIWHDAKLETPEEGKLCYLEMPLWVSKDVMTCNLGVWNGRRYQIPLAKVGDVSKVLRWCYKEDLYK